MPNIQADQLEVLFLMLVVRQVRLVLLLREYLLQLEHFLEKGDVN